MSASRTHFATATVLGGVLAVSGAAAGVSGAPPALLCLCLASLGGYLPDVDADNSLPLKATFHWGAVGLAFLALFHSADRFSVAELSVLWLGVYLLTRVVGAGVFERLTVHRGLFHSVPAALLFSALTVVICHRGFALSALRSWVGGGFLFLGYLSHLLLDELQALNLFGVGSRKSLGSACKLWSRNNPQGTLWLYAAAAAILLAAPSPEPVFTAAADPALYRALYDSLLPHAGWFRSPTAP